jgi:hypothetical protein
VRNKALTSGISTSCGCGIVKISPNQLFGFWKVLELKGTKSLCLCTGCNVTQSLVLNRNLRTGRSNSCGCQTNNLTKATCLSKYGAESFLQSNLRKDQQSDIQDKIRSTSLQRYGTTNPAQNQEIRQKISKTKQSYTEEQKQEIENKRIQTCLEKYDVSHVGKTSWRLEKAKQTNLERYGVENYSKVPECQEKMKQTNLERYGVENYAQSKQFQQQLIDIGMKIVLSTGIHLSDYANAHNVPLSSVYAIYNKSGESAALLYIENYTNNLYTTEASFINLLSDYIPNLTKYDKQPLEFQTTKRPDFRLEKNNKVLYINIDGLRYHNELVRNKQSHYELAKTFRENNIRLMQFREDELYNKGHIIKSIIKNYFGDCKRVQARSCLLKPISNKESKAFFEKNHLMGHRNGHSYGLFWENQLLAVMSVVKKKDGLEIARFATKIDYQVQGAFSKLLNFIADKYNATFIESYCDLRYSSGISYEKCGFQLQHITDPGFVWTDFKKTYHRLQCKANMDERKLSQAQYAAELKWYKIYDAGQASFRKDLK